MFTLTAILLTIATIALGGFTVWAVVDAILTTIVDVVFYLTSKRE